MKAKIWFPALLVLFGICGCRSKCSIGCNVQPNALFIGFSLAELDTVIITSFAPDGQFATQLYTGKVYGSPYFLDTNAICDTATFVDFSSMYYGTLLKTPGANDVTYNDFELSIPSIGRTFKISNLIVNGDVSETVLCDHDGSAPYGAQCQYHQYISSYILNGVQVNFSPKTNCGTIYLSR